MAGFDDHILSDTEAEAAATALVKGFREALGETPGFKEVLVRVVAPEVELPEHLKGILVEAYLSEDATTKLNIPPAVEFSGEENTQYSVSYRVDLVDGKHYGGMSIRMSQPDPRIAGRREETSIMLFSSGHVSFESTPYIQGKADWINSQRSLNSGHSVRSVNEVVAGLRGQKRG
jgi:hypothetical protein